jgi:dimethylamine--corrinoid protein Co-methyltransferase
MDLSNEEMMHEIREDLDIGTIIAIPGSTKGIAAKCRIAELLNITIHSVDLFKAKIDLKP